MAAIDQFLGQLRAEILDDIEAWRSGGWRLCSNNEDITERWIQNQQVRAAKVGTMLTTDEKPPLYLYGDY